MKRNPNIHRIITWVILAGTTYIFFSIYGNVAQDDAYITYRYARNLAMGNGFVYNIDEWVLGTTTPLYTILLALIASLTKLDVVRVSTILSGICLWVSSGILYELGRSSDHTSSFFLSLIFLTNPFLRNFIGMESYLLLCFILLTVWAYRRNKLLLASVCNGLLILVRYEMIFLSVIIGIWETIKKRKLPYWLIPGYGLVFGWLLYATLVFRSPIPLSASAKLLAPRISFLFGGAVYWYQTLNENPAFFLSVIIFLTGAFGIILSKKSTREYKIILVFAIVYLVIASLFAGSFPWYYAPLVPGFAIIVIVGIEVLSDFLKLNRFKKKAANNHGLRLNLTVILSIMVIMIQSTYWVKDFQAFRGKIGDDRYVIYKPVSDWLNENASSQHSIATFEIGYIGYFTDMKIIDLAGLVTPELFEWVDDGAEASLYHALSIFAPDFVLIPEANTNQIEIMREKVNYETVEKSFTGYLLYRKK